MSPFTSSFTDVNIIDANKHQSGGKKPKASFSLNLKNTYCFYREALYFQQIFASTTTYYTS